MYEPPATSWDRIVGDKPISKPMSLSAKPTAAPAKVAKRRKRSALRAEGSGCARRFQLRAEPKRIAPERTAKLNYTQVSTQQLEPMVEVEEAKKPR